MQQGLTAQEGGKLIIHALERGVDFIDTAQYYQAYSHISYAVKAGFRDFVYCTKSYAYDRSGAENALREALESTGREYVDIFLLHETESAHTIRGHSEALGYYIDMKRKGYIKAVGVSTHYARAARSAALTEGIEVVEAVANVDGLGIADASLEEMEGALRLCRQCGRGVVAIKAIGGGNLYRRAAECLAYARSLSEADIICIGMSSTAEIDANASYFEGSGEVVFEDLPHNPKSLHIEDWCIGCGACVKRCASRALSIVNGKASCNRARCLVCGYCSQACPEMALKIFSDRGV
jgi:predicted aldo/keto reductase-like oxidoreductase